MFEQQVATVNCYLIETSWQESPLSTIADKGGSLKVFSGWLATVILKGGLTRSQNWRTL